MLPFLTAEQLQSLRPNGPPPEPVEVPEWGGSVYIRRMTGSDRDAWEESNHNENRKAGKDKVSLRNFRARLLVFCISDADGKRVFRDDQVDWLGEQDGLVIDRLFGVAKRVNKLLDQDIKELAKNSEAAPSGNSGSS